MYIVKIKGQTHYNNCIIRIDTSWLGCMFSIRSLTVPLSLMQDFVQNVCLLIPLQTTTLQPRNSVTVSKRLLIPAIVFMT
jgi:hypothetical protein